MSDIEESLKVARSDYDTLYGFLLGTPNPQIEKEIMLRHLNNLYQNYVFRLGQSQAAETVDAKQQSDGTGDVSTASSSTPSGSSTGKSSRDLSYPASEDVGTT